MTPRRCCPRPVREKPANSIPGLERGPPGWAGACGCCCCLGGGHLPQACFLPAQLSGEEPLLKLTRETQNPASRLLCRGSASRRRGTRPALCHPPLATWPSQPPRFQNRVSLLPFCSELDHRPPNPAPLPPPWTPSSPGSSGLKRWLLFPQKLTAGLRCDQTPCEVDAGHGVTSRQQAGLLNGVRSPPSTDRAGRSPRVPAATASRSCQPLFKQSRATVSSAGKVPGSWTNGASVMDGEQTPLCEVQAASHQPQLLRQEH